DRHDARGSGLHLQVGAARRHERHDLPLHRTHRACARLRPGLVAHLATHRQGARVRCRIRAVRSRRPLARHAGVDAGAVAVRTGRPCGRRLRRHADAADGDAARRHQPRREDQRPGPRRHLRRCLDGRRDHGYGARRRRAHAHPRAHRIPGVGRRRRRRAERERHHRHRAELQHRARHHDRPEPVEPRPLPAAPQRHRRGDRRIRDPHRNRVGHPYRQRGASVNPAIDADAIIARLADLRAGDPPTHGGRVLSYVYDSGLAALGEVARAAIAQVLPVNGLDPTTFGSVGVLESELVGFVRELLHGDADVVGSATSGGTESCLLAVKTARDVWRQTHPEGRPRLVAPSTVHAAFQKAAAYFDLALDLVPVASDGTVAAADVVARLDDDVALVVLSAPNYPFATLDPVVEVAAATDAAGIALHVDACIGGLVLPFWTDAADAPLPAWDFRVPGVTSMSADLHKYGYAPKGASVVLQRGRDRQRHQFFATTRWPGYPVVNPTLLGSKSAAPLAAAWAISQWLGAGGFAELAASCARSTAALRAAVAGIE